MLARGGHVFSYSVVGPFAHVIKKWKSEPQHFRERPRNIFITKSAHLLMYSFAPKSTSA